MVNLTNGSISSHGEESSDGTQNPYQYQYASPRRKAVIAKGRSGVTTACGMSRRVSEGLAEPRDLLPCVPDHGAEDWTDDESEQYGENANMSLEDILLRAVI
jgi:hypothetical protein